MATVMTEPERVGNSIVMTREPAGPKKAGDKGSMGDQAVMDAVILVGAAWLILFFFAFSLRRHNA